MGWRMEEGGKVGDPEKCRQDIAGLQTRGQGCGRETQHRWGKN